MSVPSLVRQPSIGHAAFAHQLEVGMQLLSPSESFSRMEEEEGQEDVAAVEQKQERATLAALPAQTQMEEVEDGGDDDRVLEMLTEKFASLNAKTHRMKELWAKKHAMQQVADDAGKNPFTILESMHDAIDAEEEGEEKQHDVKMFNAISTIFETARTNKNLREFVADLFQAERTYYDMKEERASVEIELRQLTKLYDEQELEQTMANLKKAQEARKAKLVSSGKEKAEKRASAAEEAASKKKAKK